MNMQPDAALNACGFPMDAAIAVELPNSIDTSASPSASSPAQPVLHDTVPEACNQTSEGGGMPPLERRSGTVGPNTVVASAAELTAVTARDSTSGDSSVAGSSNSVSDTAGTCTELKALRALYQNTGGSLWTRKYGWFSESVPLHDWHGLEGVENNTVVELELDGNSLIGPLPKEIQGLMRLRILGLSDNLLNGLVPKEIGNIRSLTNLDLSYNGFIGGIPTEFGRLTNLTVLQLTKCGLSGEIPKSLGKLTQLLVLHLGNNKLEGVIPSELKHLVDVTQICFEDNKLGGVIPHDLLDKMENLEGIWFRKNNFEGPLPRALGKPQMLKELKTLKLAGKIYVGKADRGGDASEGNRFAKVPPKGVLIENDAAAVLQFRREYCGLKTADNAPAPTQRSASKEESRKEGRKRLRVAPHTKRPDSQMEAKPPLQIRPVLAAVWCQ